MAPDDVERFTRPTLRAKHTLPSAQRVAVVEQILFHPARGLLPLSRLPPHLPARLRLEPVDEQFELVALQLRSRAHAVGALER